MIVDKNMGVQKTRYSITKFYEDEDSTEELWIDFRGPTMEEYGKINLHSMEVAIDDGETVKVEIKGKGEVKGGERAVSVKNLDKNLKFLVQLVGKCIIDHNFTEKIDDKEVSYKKEKVWAWVQDRYALCNDIIKTWNEKFPLR